MRYIHIPAVILLVHPETGNPLPGEAPREGVPFKQAEYPWEAFARGLFLHPQLSSLDVLEVYDLRTRVLSAKNGETLQLDDGPWQMLVNLARKPAGMAPMFALQAVPYVRAIVDAKTEGTAAHAAPAPPPAAKKKR